jgi:BON domain
VRKNKEKMHMRPLLLAFTLLLAASGFAQQPPSPSSPQLTMPQGQMPPDQRVPPDQTSEGLEPPGSQSTAAAQVQEQIQEALAGQPALSTAKIRVNANDTAVVLSGVVSDEGQHQRALRVAALHASGLRIVDHIKVQQ